MLYSIGIDCSGPVCSVALFEGAICLGEEISIHRQAHAAETTLLIQSVLQKNNCRLRDIKAIAVSNGPGSYTGLRIGLSIAKGIAYGLDIPLICISTLQALAWQAAKSHPGYELYVPTIDARREEIYYAVYDAAGKEITTPVARILEEDFLYAIKGKGRAILVGDGCDKCRRHLLGQDLDYDGAILSRASAMGPLIADKIENKTTEAPAYAVPFYLKDFYSPLVKK